MEKRESINKNELINKYNSLIEETKGKLFLWLGYEQQWILIFNKAYFDKWQEITKEYIEEQREKADKIIQSLKKINEDIDKENILNDAQKKLLNDFIERNILSLQYHQNAIYIEAEKAGYKLTEDGRNRYRKNILEIEDKLYWDPITKLEKRKNEVIHKLHEVFEKNNNELSEDEKTIREKKIIQQFPSIKAEKKESELEINKGKEIYIDEEHIFDLMSLLLEIEWFKKEDIIKIQVEEKYTTVDIKDWIYHIPAKWKNEEIYKFFDQEGLWQKFKIVKQTKGNNSVSISKENDKFKENMIKLAPGIDGKYLIKNKVLPIMFDHEVSTHINTGIGNFYNTYIKDPERSDLEEGIALLNQKMAENKDISELYETSIGDISMFLWENFDEKDTEKLLTIYFKLTKDNGQDPEWRARRIKIWVPLWEKWARRKDLTYGNGKEIIRNLEELTKTPEWIEILNTYARAIYSTKLWYDSIKNIDNILDWIKNLEDLEPNFPIFAGKILYRKLFKGKLNKDAMLENDLRKHIKTNKEITYHQKKLLIEMLQIIKTYGKQW